MFHNLSGTTSTDPLYLLLAEEDEAEAEAYEATLCEGQHQLNMGAEQYNGGEIDFGNEAFSLDTDFTAELSAQTDTQIHELVEFILKKGK